MSRSAGLDRSTRPDPARRSDRALDLVRRFAAAPRAEESRPAFLDGLLLGAMVGAAIAGSTVWNRRRARRRAASAGADAATEVPPATG